MSGGLIKFFATAYVGLSLKAQVCKKEKFNMV